MIALALVRYRFRTRAATNILIFLPLSTPEIVLGASLLTLFLHFTFVPFGFWTILIAHVMFCISFAVVTVKARLIGFDRHLEEAAMDLGANEWMTFQKVTLPLITPAILAAFLLCFAISIDDFVVTYFNAGNRGHVPDLRLGCGAQRRSGSGERDRHGDLRDRHLGSARQRAHPDAPREARLSLPSVEPRLPSWWLEDALAREGDPAPAPALAGDATADVAIVGGGYTGPLDGARAARAAPDLRITLLEAEICGHGPSGRNGGFVHGYWASLPGILPVLGEERALELARAGEQIIPGIRAWAEARGEDVWLRRGRDARGVGRAGAGRLDREGGGRRRACRADPTRPSP